MALAILNDMHLGISQAKLMPIIIRSHRGLGSKEEWVHLVKTTAVLAELLSIVWTPTTWYQVVFGVQLSKHYGANESLFALAQKGTNPNNPNLAL